MYVLNWICKCVANCVYWINAIDEFHNCKCKCKSNIKYVCNKNKKRTSDISLVRPLFSCDSSPILSIQISDFIHRHNLSPLILVIFLYYQYKLILFVIFGVKINQNVSKKTFWCRIQTATIGERTRFKGKYARYFNIFDGRCDWNVVFVLQGKIVF